MIKVPDEYAPVGLKLDAAGNVLGPLAFLGIIGATADVGGLAARQTVPGTSVNFPIPFTGNVLVIAQFQIQCFQDNASDTEVAGIISSASLGVDLPNQRVADKRFGTFTGAGSTFVSIDTVHAMAVQAMNQGDVLNLNLVVQDTYHTGAHPSTTFAGATGYMAFLIAF